MTQNAHPRRWPRVLRPFINRPIFMTSIAFGLVIYFATAPWITRDVTRALIAWDAGVVLIIVLMSRALGGADIEQMKRSAIVHDEGRHIVLVLMIFAAVASIGALFAELSQAKVQPGADLRVILAAGTIVLSWAFMQVVFATHYAHVYYLAEKSGERRGGLDFGPQGEPDYWDFLHFSIVMGATAQTADITFTTREMRRIGTVHTLVAFGFNTAILATMINLAAAYF